MKKMTNIRKRLSLDVVWRGFIILFVGSVLVSGAPIPDKIIGVYSAWAVWTKLESLWSFVLAIGFLVAIPLLLLFGIKTVEQSFSVYAYYFLVTGFIQILAEHLRSSRGVKPIKLRIKS